MRALKTPLLMINGSGSAAAITAGTRYAPIFQGGGTGASGDTTEANRRAYARTSGTLFAHTIRVQTASTTNTIVTTRKNSAAGAATITCIASTTGLFQDLLTRERVTAGDVWNYRYVVGTSGITFRGFSCIFQADGNSWATIFGNSGSLVFSGSAGNYYMTVGSSVAQSASEATAKCRINAAGVMANLQVMMSANARTGTCSFRTRKNGAGGNQLVTFLTTVTGHVEDTSNTDTIASGDDFDIEHAVAGTGSITVMHKGCTFTTTTGDGIIIAANPGGVTTQNFASTTYRILGGSIGSTATESEAQLPAMTPMKFSKASLYVGANGIAATTTVRTRINGNDGNISISITASTTGLFEDLSNTDSVLPADLVNWSVVTGGASGTINVLQQSLVTTQCDFFENTAFMPRQAVNRASTY